MDIFKWKDNNYKIYSPPNDTRFKAPPTFSQTKRRELLGSLLRLARAITPSEEQELRSVRLS
jgi:hypothetical protein